MCLELMESHYLHKRIQKKNMDVPLLLSEGTKGAQLSMLYTKLIIGFINQFG